MIQATAQTKLLNFASNVGGFILFALIGSVAWKLGIVMAVGQLIGARIGASLAIANGAKLIRPLLVLMSVLMAMRLLPLPLESPRLVIPLVRIKQSWKTTCSHGRLSASLAYRINPVEAAEESDPPVPRQSRRARRQPVFPSSPYLLSVTLSSPEGNCKTRVILPGLTN